jgi:hypothetical protein
MQHCRSLKVIRRYKMHCDHQLVSDLLLDYIDQKLSTKVSHQVEQAINQCETCQATYRQAVELHQMADQWQQQSVPAWHRTEYAVKPKTKTQQWLSWSALATSTLAIFMVVFQVQISSNDSGLQIAFGGNSNGQVSAKLEALVQQKLDAYRKEQNLMLDARFIAATNNQITQSKLLVAQALEKSRDERRDDLNFLVTGIQSQRYEDSQKIEKRLAYLADNQIENNQYINQLIQFNHESKGDK